MTTYYHYKATVESVVVLKQIETIEFKCSSLRELTKLVFALGREHFVHKWTCWEYSDSQFSDLISEVGADHPCNSDAIFWEIYDGLGCYEDGVLAY